MSDKPSQTLGERYGENDARFSSVNGSKYNWHLDDNLNIGNFNGIEIEEFVTNAFQEGEDKVEQLYNEMLLIEESNQSHRTFNFDQDRNELIIRKREYFSCYNPSR